MRISPFKPAMAGGSYLVIGGESVYGNTSSTPNYLLIAMHNLEHGFTIVVL